MNRPVLIGGSVVVFLLTVAARAESEIAAARELIEKWQAAVVNVKIVSEQYEYESKVEVFGTVVDSTGLTVLSLTRSDPAGAGMWEANADRKIKDVKMIRADGSEIACDIVLRDEELDLLFIRPSMPVKKKLPCVDLKNSAALKLLDEILVIARLGETAGYVPAVSLCRVHAVIEKPRTCYVSDFISVLSSLGAPAFSLDGRIAGILLVKITKTGAGGSDMFTEFGGMMPVILPAGAVREVVDRIK